MFSAVKIFFQPNNIFIFCLGVGCVILNFIANCRSYDKNLKFTLKSRLIFVILSTITKKVLQSNKTNKTLLSKGFMIFFHCLMPTEVNICLIIISVCLSIHDFGIPFWLSVFVDYAYNFGSGTVSGKMLLVGIVENNKIDAYFRAV